MAIEREVIASIGPVKLTSTGSSSTTVTTSITTSSGSPDNAPPEVPELDGTTIDVGERGDDGSRVLVGVISAEDPDGDTLVFTENSAEFEIENGRLYYVGDRVEEGDSWNISIAASDGKGGTTSRTFTIRADDDGTVPPPPPPPPPPNRDPDIQVTRQDDTILAGRAGPFVVATFTVTDPDSDQVAVSDNSSVFETRSLGGGAYELVYTGAALDLDAPDPTVNVRANDGRGGTDVQSFRFDVAEPPNSAPEIVVTQQDPKIPGLPGKFQVAQFTVADPDGDAIQVGDDSDNFEIKSLGDGKYVLMYAGPALPQDAPDQSVTVTASDGRGDTDTHSFTFDVTITVNCAEMVLPEVDIVYGTDGNDNLSASVPSYFALATGLYASGADTVVGSNGADVFDVEPDTDGVWNDRIDGAGTGDVVIDGVTYLGIDVVCLDRSLDLSVVPEDGSGSVLKDIQGYYFHNVVAETFTLDSDDIDDRAGLTIDLDSYASTDGFDYRAAECLFVFDEPTAEPISVRFDLAQGETVVDLNGGQDGRQANDTFRIMGEALDMNVYGIDSGSDGQPDRYLVVEAGVDVLFV